MKLLKIERLKETQITAHDDLFYGTFVVPYPNKLIGKTSQVTNYLPNQLKLSISEFHCKDNDNYYNLTLSDLDDSVFHIHSKDLSELNSIYNKIIANQPLNLEVFKSLEMKD